MQITDIAKLVLLLIVSLVFASIVDKESIISLLYMLPNILGILLAGVLASLAIIFGLLSSNELAIIHRYSKEIKNEGLYDIFIKETKTDAKIIFTGLCFSVLILLIYHINSDIITVPAQFLLGLGLFALFISISAVYDIIMSLFYLNQLRYELSTNNTSSRDEGKIV